MRALPMWRFDGLTPAKLYLMARRKTTYYIDEGVLTAAKVTAAATHRSESELAEEALRRYVVEEGQGEYARKQLSALLQELRERPELKDLDDDQSMQLAVKETRAARRARARRRPDASAA